MIISVDSTVKAMQQKFAAAFKPSTFRWAVANAINTTAFQARAEVQKNMRSRFTIRRDWVIKGISVEKAKTGDLLAVVYSKDDYMERQESGRNKRPKQDRYLAIPMKAVRRGKTDIIRAADLPNNLGKKVATMMYGKKRKEIKGAGGITFIMKVRGRKYIARKRTGAGGKEKIELLYLLVPSAKIPKRLNLASDTSAIVAKNFGTNLENALQYAISQGWTVAPSL